MEVFFIPFCSIFINDLIEGNVRAETIGTRDELIQRKIACCSIMPTSLSCLSPID
jgi:hypothetical protein